MTNKAFYQLFIILFLQLICLELLAQKITVSPTNVSVTTDQSFKIEYRVDDIQNPNIQLPQFEDFAVVGGPNNYQSMQMTNGKVTQFQSVSYILQPRKAGNFTIKPASLKHKGKTLKSTVIKVKVSQGKQNSKAQANGSNAATATGGKTFDLPKGAKDYMFLVAETDTNSFFMGEQITVRYNLYTKYDVTNYQLEDNPTFTGFWVQDLTPQRISHSKKMVNGEIYLVYPLKTFALFAQKSGEIPMFAINATITYREAVGGQQRGFFQNYRTRKLNVRNKASNIKVFPLPEANKPDSFTGAVGKFGCSVKTDKRICEVNEAITINVNITGTGNLMLIEPSKLDFPESFDVYEPEMNENIYERSAQITGSKSYEYVVVPTEEGTFKLPAVPFAYFDPEAQTYKSINGRETVITVKPSTNPELKDKPKQEKDIADISLQTSLKNSTSKAAIWMPVLGLLYAIPFLLFPALVKRKREEELTSKDVIGKKRRQALALAQKRLEVAKQHLNKNEKKDFYTETIQAIWGYISDKLNLKTADLSKDNARQLLLNEGISELLTGELISTIEYCEMAIYAPVPGADKLDNTYNNTLRIIADIEEGVDKTDEETEA